MRTRAAASQAQSTVRRAGRLRRGTVCLSLVAAALATSAALIDCTGPEERGVANPHPVHLARPAAAPLSVMAQLGRSIFYDSTLSGSGTRSCASCHEPDHAYGMPGRSTVQVAPPTPSRYQHSTSATGTRRTASTPPTAGAGAGAGAGSAGAGAAGIVRAIPSLRYAYRAPIFSIGPVLDDADDAVLAAAPAQPVPAGSRAEKVAGSAPPPDLMVARGGFFWDGRAGTLQEQAMGPLFNPNEMANPSVAWVARRLRRAPYASRFVALFGKRVFDTPDQLLDEAMFAVARFQIEDPSFHPYDSKYDLYLEGRATLTPAEWRGLQAFEDEKRGNCAACHLDQPRSDGLPPAFSDYEYVTLGVPRDTTRTPPGVTDLGACGPLRTDLRDPQYCGAFRTPSLRNTALRSEFFHNGVYRTLDEVLEFYNFRDTRPERVYPASPDGAIRKFDDLPARYHANIDTTDGPFDRHLGDPPAMSDQDMRDIVAFLKTLTDGWTDSTARGTRP